MIDVVSDDQAFDAVGDVASSLGVQYRRLSYRSLRGQLGEEVRHVAADDRGSGNRRRGRGGRGRRSGGGRRHEPAPRHPAPMPHRQPPPRPAVVAEVVEDDANAHTAPHDELIDVVRDLMHTAPGGVTLDQLANALRERGFRRTPGSPRLITRLKRIKQLDVNRNGLIRLVDAEADATPHHRHAAAPVEDTDDGFSIDPEDAGEGDDEVAVTADAGEGPSDTEPSSAEGGQRRRRRRRGGRRRRGRRGGGNGANGNGDVGGEVLAAAPTGSPSDY
jgi:ribonuclease E